MSALVEFSMFPTEQTQSKKCFRSPCSGYCGQKRSALSTHSDGTIIEGETVAEVLEVINEAYEEL